MAKQLLYFSGVQISENQMNGFITSDQIVDNFDKSWLPYYQRERVPSPKKIRELINIFQSKGKIDSIKINLIGEYNFDKKRGDALLEGLFHLIDGQQRCWSLKDSKVRDIRIPVELYLNLPDEEARKLFQQYNKDATKLTFGEYAKSANGVFGIAIRELLRKKGATAIPLTINGKISSMGLSGFCPLVYSIHRRLYRDLKVMRTSHGKDLLKFLEDQTYDPKEVAISLYAARKILQASVETFGTYDSKATAYRRSFFQAWCQVVIHNFLTGSGNIDVGKFRTKIRDIPTKLVVNAQVKELVANGGDVSADILYDKVVDHLNYKLKDGHLPRTGEIVQSDKALKHIVGAARNKHLANQPLPF